MHQQPLPFEQPAIAKHLALWFVRIAPVSIIIGLLVALFLWVLDVVTQTRWNHPWLLALLPLAGVVIVLLYKVVGKRADAGNNLILDEIHMPGGGVPLRMSPLIILTTLITHLFGGSAGREGTAVQVGGSISALFARWFQLRHEEKRILLMSGMAAGFGAVFGTPVTGAIFALEVLTIGRIKYDALLPCLMASVLAHLTTMATGISHTSYAIATMQAHQFSVPFLSVNLVLMAKVLAAGAIFGLCSYLFSELTHLIKTKCQHYIHSPLLVPIAGGISVVGISYAVGSWDYLGLGVTTPDVGGVSIVSAFKADGAEYWSWILKLLLTAITIGTGFQGGEVTPLFFIGATLGNSLAVMTGAPIDLFAALGFIAVFAGATNTPIACTLMGIELFGAEYTLYYAVACFTAYYFSGHTGIYGSQRVAVNKLHQIKSDEAKIRQ